MPGTDHISCCIGAASTSLLTTGKRAVFLTMMFYNDYHRKGERMKFYLSIIFLFFSVNNSNASNNVFSTPFDSKMGRASAVDNNGNLFWIAATEDPKSGTALYVNKYTENGALLWEKNYPIMSGYGFPMAFESQTDYEKNLLILSRRTDGAGAIDAVILMKIKSDGTLLWTHNKLGGGKGVAGATSKTISIDPSNNIYVFIRSVDNGDKADAIVEKYNSAGKLLWSKTFDSGLGDFPVQVEVTNKGTVFAHLHAINPSSSVHGGYRSVLLQYDTNGNLVSDNIHFPKEFLLEDFVIDRFVFDPINNGVYVLGKDCLMGRANVLSKFDKTGKMEWVKIGDFSGVKHINNLDLPMVVDSNGDLLMLRDNWTITSKGVSELYLEKISSTGKLLASKKFEGWGLMLNANNHFSGYQFEVLKNGKVYIFTKVYESSTGDSVFLLIDSDKVSSFATAGSSSIHEVFRLKGSVGAGANSFFVSGKNGQLYSALSWAKVNDPASPNQYRTIIHRHP